jgi:hypothetical protein
MPGSTSSRGGSLGMSSMVRMRSCAPERDFRRDRGKKKAAEFCP